MIDADSDLDSIDTSIPTPSPPRELPSPLVTLDRGYYYVNIRSGDATPMPASITSVRGATNFEVSPDGSRILFDNSGIQRRAKLGRNQVFIANIDGSDVSRLTNDPIGASDGTWSSDGSKVVYVGASTCCRRKPAALKVMDLETATASVVARKSWLHIMDPLFSSDGSRILVTRWDRGPEEDPRDDLWTIPRAGGSLELFLEDRGSGEPSPDGTRIIYPWIETKWGGSGHCAGDYGVAWISNADGGDPRPLVRRATSEGRGTWPRGWSPDGSRIAFGENLLAFEPCRWESLPGAYVMNVATGRRTLITFGWPIGWLNNHTLLVEAKPDA